MTLPAVLRDRLRLPVVGSPLFIVSGPELVIAQCKAGIVGSFPSLNARPVSQLDEWLARITEELAAHDKAHPEAPAAPFAVNQIVHKTNNRLEADVGQVTLNFFAGFRGSGIPRIAFIDLGDDVIGVADRFDNRVR